MRLLDFLKKKTTESAEWPETEITALTKAAPCGYGAKTDQMTGSLQLLAYIDTASDNLYSGAAAVHWKYDGRKEKVNKFSIKGLEIYRFRVLKESESQLHMIEVTDRGCSDPRLEAVRKEFSTPVTLELPGGDRLTLNRNLGCFCGYMNFAGGTVDINLITDGKDSITANDAMKGLCSILPYAGKWDRKIRAFAAEKLLSEANELSDTPVSEVDIAEQLECMSISIYEEKYFEASFLADGIFSGQWVTVSGTAPWDFKEAVLEG